MSSLNQEKDLAYLMPQKFCPTITLIALMASTLTFIVLCLVAINSANLLFSAEGSIQLKLFFEVLFLLACTSALWKHAMNE